MGISPAGTEEEEFWVMVVEGRGARGDGPSAYRTRDIKDGSIVRSRTIREEGARHQQTRCEMALASGKRQQVSAIKAALLRPEAQFHHTIAALVTSSNRFAPVGVHRRVALGLLHACGHGATNKQPSCDKRKQAQSVRHLYS